MTKSQLKGAAVTLVIAWVSSMTITVVELRVAVANTRAQQSVVGTLNTTVQTEVLPTLHALTGTVEAVRDQNTILMKHILGDPNGTSY